MKINLAVVQIRKRKIANLIVIKIVRTEIDQEITNVQSVNLFITGTIDFVGIWEMCMDGRKKYRSICHVFGVRRMNSSKN